jgi:NADH:ubiquinone oxidoreductase subunit 6 (subunit J)
MEMIGSTLLMVIIILGFVILRTKSPVTAILSVIGIFALTSGMLALEGELSILSLTFLIIYVGAIAILFLFIVFLLNLRKTEEPNEQFVSGLQTALITGLTLPAIILVLTPWLSWFEELGPIAYEVQIRTVDPVFGTMDIEVIAEKVPQLEVLTAMYNSTSFWLIGIILLVAMLGVILLSKESRKRMHKKDDDNKPNNRK